MSDRLNELKRQRALVAEHLQWLDREIASCAPSAVPPAAVTPPPELVAPPSALPLAPRPPAAAAPPRETDPGLLLLQDEERRRGEVSKSGCWIVFTVLLLAIVGTVTAIILVKYR